MREDQLADGLYAVPAGKLPCVVTSLEMHARPPETAFPPPAGLSIRLRRDPDPDWYRRLYRSVGEPWLWWSRLELADAVLARIIRDPAVEILAVEGRGAVGLAELDFRKPGECELVYFGLAPGLTGQGIGRWLMQHAIAAAWARPIARFWVHTCTLDDPKALPFYVKAGFIPYRRQIEIADDPRALDLWPKTAAPDIPLL